MEMKSLESLPIVLQLNDRVPDFQKFPVMVKASEAEKNYLAKQASDAFFFPVVFFVLFCCYSIGTGSSSKATQAEHKTPV